MFENFGGRLRSERKRLGLNQSELAAAGGVALLSQSNYENGKRKPNAEYLAAVAARGVDIQYVLTGIKAKQDDQPSSSINADAAFLSVSADTGEDITLRLREELQRLGLSQAKAASLAGEKSPHRIKAILSGRQKCPPDLLAALTKIGVDAIYVLTGQIERNSSPSESESAVMSTIMSEEIFGRFREEFDRIGLSFAEVARQIGEKSPARIRDIYHGRQRCPIEVLSSLAKVGIEYDYVITGKRKESDFQWKNISSVVPLYDLEAAAGHGCVLDQENVIRMCSIDDALLNQHGLRADQCAMLTVKGDSMEPTLLDGDTILIDRSQTTPDGIFLIQMDDTLRVKRVQRAAGRAYILISDNTRYREELIPPTALDTIRLLGKCVLKISSVS